MKTMSKNLVLAFIGLVATQFLTISLYAYRYSASEQTESTTRESVPFSTSSNMNADKSIGKEGGHSLEETATRAVVHMGVHKTGTTTIQRTTAQYKNQLQMDGYEMPWSFLRENGGPTNLTYQFRVPHNQMNFARCFILDEHIPFKCIPGLLHYGSEIAEQKKNLLVSAEWFSNIEAAGIGMLKNYLSQWDQVSIIVYYRRFFGYLKSMHYEVFKHQKKPGSCSRPSIIDFIDSHLDNDHGQGYPWLGRWFNMYTAPLVQRLKEHFDVNEIIVRDFDDDSKDDLLESFFCRALPGANHTCNAIRKAGKARRGNAGSSFDYSDLACAALEAGLIRSKENDGHARISRHVQRIISTKVQRYHEETRNLTISDFQRVCPPSHVLDKIWNISLTSEMMLFPERFHQPRAASELRADFDIAARTSLCAMDVTKTLAEETWQSFFNRTYDDDDDSLDDDDV